MSRASVSDTCKILMIDLDNDASEIVTLVNGNFLNFSKDHLITGVNLIDDLLFWTDDRNQPRRINIQNATTPNYYTTEDQISVATYAPFQPIQLYRKRQFYPEIVHQDGQKGWIEFGEPGPEYHWSAAQKTRRVKPKPGLMVLFPSYTFHRTIPFESDQTRISIAFDVVPNS